MYIVIFVNKSTHVVPYYQHLLNHLQLHHGLELHLIQFQIIYIFNHLMVLAQGDITKFNNITFIFNKFDLV